MRIETTTRTLYKFEELSKEAKEKAIESLYDLNVDHEWWDSVYDDAENIGLKITSFDIDHHEIEGKFINTAIFTAEAIKKNHGESCETYKTAMEYFSEREKVINAERERLISNGENLSEFNPNEVGMDEVDAKFLKSLLEDYLIMLRNEYDYLTSENDWDRSIMFVKSEMKIREYKRLTKNWEYAGCGSENLAAWIKGKLAK